MGIRPAPKDADLSGVLFAWISPEGDLYICGKESHEETAGLICQKLGIELCKLWNCHGDELLKRGWIKLSNWGFAYEMEPRDIHQGQINTCFDLAAASGRKEIKEAFDVMIGNGPDESHLEGAM